MDPVKVCIICQQDYPGDVFYGELLSKGDVTVHEFCLLFSSSLYAESDAEANIENSLEAYNLDKIREYAEKKSLQKCFLCDCPHATVNCRNRKCKRIFHYKCGFDSGECQLNFDGLFHAYCPTHRTKEKLKPMDGQFCIICLLTFDGCKALEMINLNCNPKSWMHRECAIQLAAAKGYSFACPSCCEVSAFQKYISRKGVNIPQRDTQTQAHNEAYYASQAKYCEAEVCLRAMANREKKIPEKLLSEGMTFVKCSTCGKTFHADCGEKNGKFGSGEREEAEGCCSSCMTISDDEWSIPSSKSSSDEGELDQAFDLGSECSEISVFTGEEEKTGTEEKGGKEEKEESEGEMTQRLSKRFKFERFYKWTPTPGYKNEPFRQFKLNLFMNHVRPGVKRKRDEDDGFCD